MFSVPRGVHGEFEGFEAVILGEVRHEGRECIGRGSGVREDIRERRRTETVGARDVHVWNWVWAGGGCRGVGGYGG